MKRLAATLLLVAVAGSTGCATVPPWKRERLAARAMQLEADPLAAELAEHTHEVREGARGGAGAGGGGCGCT